MELDWQRPKLDMPGTKQTGHDRNQAKRPTHYRCWKLKLFDVQNVKLR